MQARLATAIGMFAGLMLAAPAFAQTAPPSQPTGQQWQPQVKAEPQVAGVTLDEKQVTALRAVSKYFNDLKVLKGAFAQTAPDGKRQRGKFSLKQPGKFRFDYGFGSKLIVMSDGKNLAIQDPDVNSDTRYQVDDTPFRILLRKDVDLLRDSRVFEVQEVEDLVIVSLGDKSPDISGKIRLFFTKKPALELKEWVTTDPQGNDTRVEIAELVKTEDVDDAQYRIQSLPQPK
jgi:outer membrane lipoprotein-sorting protein